MTTTSDSTAELSYAPRRQVDFASPGLLWSIAIVALACAALGRVVMNDFVAWDDPMWIYQNGNITAVAGESFANFWTEPFFGLYVPMTWSVWALASFIGHDV